MAAGRGACRACRRHCGEPRVSVGARASVPRGRASLLLPDGCVGALDSGAPWFHLVAAAWHALRPTLGVGGELPLAALDALAHRRDGDERRPVIPRFVAQDVLRYAAYEAYVAQTGCVPTRTTGDGAVHDLLNALVWLSMPRSKAVLNAIQSRVIARAGVAPRRGRTRDLATLFDENGAVLVTERRELADALRHADWRALFVAHRPLFGTHARVRVFGHALMHKLFRPYKSICAHALVVVADPAVCDATLDRLLADELAAALADDGRGEGDASEDGVAARVLHPLPVCGVPGWWPGNAEPGFYDDASVFRAPRARRRPPARDGVCDRREERRCVS